MLGSQRRLFRLCEKVTVFPKAGSLPQISQRYGIKTKLLERPGRLAGRCEVVPITDGVDSIYSPPEMRLVSDDIKRVIGRFHERLTTYRDALNGLNVYPVPDGDTGTNMTLTLGSVLEHLDGASSMVEVADGMSHGSLMGARGNSGIILSQILRGLADTFRQAEDVGVDDLVSALGCASDAAYQAVQQPVEGTILTVLREASEAAGEVGTAAGDDLASLLRRVYSRAVEALARTQDMLPALKQAGVVDAGGAGLLLLLASFLEIVTGAEVELPEKVLMAHADLKAIHAESVSGFRYEVMYFLEAEDDIDEFRESWARVGDSIVVVGGNGLWNCHIHTDDIGSAIEAGVDIGRPRDIRVTDLKEQTGERGLHGDGFTPRAEFVDAGIGIVAVVAGAGLVRIFADLGAQGIVSGGQSMNPSTEELLRVIDSVPAQRVVVLPNNKNIVPVAEQIDALSTKNVYVVPTRSVSQGIAAMVGYQPNEDNVRRTLEDMAAAASSVIDGEVTRAVRDARIDYGLISKGEWLGIADGTIVIADRDQETALRGLVAAILPPDPELLTLYLGDDSQLATVKALEAWLSEMRPGLEVQTIDGGQPLYPYLLSLE